MVRSVQRSKKHQHADSHSSAVQEGRHASPFRRNLLAAALSVVFVQAPLGVSAALPALATVALLATLQPATAHAAAVVSTLTCDGPCSAYGVVAGSSGNIYIADVAHNQVLVRDTNGGLTTLASGFSGPYGIAVDGTGNVYVADSGNNLIRKISPAGVVTTLAGGAGATESGSADGTGTAATFSTPYSVAVDSSGNVYVADLANCLIRKITPAGVVTTLAGSDNGGGFFDGTGSQAYFSSVFGITVDGSGNVYVADTGNNAIRKITPAGVVTTLAGGSSLGHADGSGAAATFNQPKGIAVDEGGNVYVADSNNNLIRKITPAGVVTTLAGGAGGVTSGTADGTGTAATFNSPVRIAINSDGDLYVAVWGDGGIRKITLDPSLSASVPADNASNVAPGSPISLTFSAAMSIGDGYLTIVNDTDSSSEIIDVTSDGGTFAWSNGNKTLSVTPATALAADKSYHVEIDATAFVNGTSVAYPGISDSTTLNFTMVSAPAFSVTSPAASTTINAASTISYSLNKDVASGSIVFTRTGGTADANSPETCTLQGAALTHGGALNVGLGQDLNGCTSAVTLVDGATYTISLSATDSIALSGSASITSVTYDSILPTAASSSPITAKKGNGNSGAGYEAGDIITLNFSEPVHTGRVSMALLMFAPGQSPVSNGHGFGGSPGFAGVNSVGDYAPGLAITLGAGSTLVAGDTLTFGASSVYDQGGNYASGSVSFTMPSTFIPNLPGQPTIGTATPGDGSLSVAFTPPLSNGGGAITQYQVSCMSTADLMSQDRINHFAVGPNTFTATGSGSPIVVSGLSNGTEYSCKVQAQNSAGYGSNSSYGDGATPVAAAVITPEPTPGASTNPFNTSGNNTVVDLNTNLGDNSGSTYTHATNSLISNLGNLDNKVGVSDNGVVVINASTSVPVQVSSSAPDNVLFSLPTTQGVNIQIGGQGINVTTNTEPVKDSNGKTVSTVLATKTVTNEQGQSVQTVLLVTGQAQVQSSTPNQIVGGLNLASGSNLRDITVTGGSIGSIAGFAKNGNDQSGAVSAENGQVTVFVKRHKAPSSNKLGTGFAADNGDSSTLTLQAGEVARFNGNGELLGVFLGSLSGKLGKLGDRLATQAPTGLTGWPGNVPDLIGNNSPARLGGSFASAMFAAASGSSLVQDKSNGTVTISLTDNRVLYALPLGDLTVDSNKADGVVTANDGSLELTAKGVTSRFVPVLADASGFAATLSQAYGFTARLKDDGSLSVTASNGSTYLLLPRFEATPSSQAAGLGWSADSQRLSYVSAQGAQVLDPLAYDFAQLSGLVSALGQGWTLQRNSDGSLSISGPAQQQFRLLPDYAVQMAGAEAQGKSVGSPWIGTDGKLYLLYNTGFLPMLQGFSVQ